jgi:hypothetical protein
MRIAKGAGRRLEEMSQLLERFMMIRNMMSGLTKNPEALLKSPMFKDMNSMAQIAKNYGQGSSKDLLNLMSMPHQGQDRSFFSNKPKSDVKAKKDKRKQQKMARKKSKKR